MSFEESYHLCVSGELAKCRDDNDRKAALIEVIARSLGLAIAVCAEGNSQAIDQMLVGAEGYAHAEAVEKAPFVRMLARRS